MTDRRSHRWLRRRFREAFRDNVWLLPAIGAIGGFLLAMGVGTGGGPEDNPWTVTAGRSSTILFGSLGLMFTALSIVLALAAVASQNVVGRFGSRVLRIYARRSADRWVIAVFTFAAMFILTEQFQLRRLDPDAPAPIAGLSISVVLLVCVSATVIWYIAALVRWFRTDRSIAGVVKAAREVGRAIERSRRGSVPTTLSARPDGAVDIPAPSSGHLAEIDTAAMLEACRRLDAMALIQGPIGAPVVAGDPIGWVVSRDHRADLHPERVVAEVVDVSATRELTYSLEYEIYGLVDIAIIALSPAINDPNSAVEVIEEMSFLFRDLAKLPLGPYAVPDAESRNRVIVGSRTFGQLVDAATVQIVLYGVDDPNVKVALQQFATSLQRLDLSVSDQAHVDAFAAKLDHS